MEQRKRGRKPAPLIDEDQLSTQARRVIDKFGSCAKLCAALKQIGRGRDISSIYRWTAPYHLGGTDGIIPTSAWPDVLAAARYAGIVITPEDFDPRYLMPELAHAKTTPST